MIVQGVEAGVSGVGRVGAGGVVGADARAAAAALEAATFGVLAHDVGVEAAAEFDAGEVALLAVDGVVVAGRQQDGDLVLVEFLAEFGGHGVVEGGHARGFDGESGKNK